MDTTKLKPKKQEKKHRGVFEKEPGSGIWWIRYFADGKKKREKVGRKSDAISLYQQRKSEIRAGAKLPANLRRKGETLAVVINRAIDWYTSHRPRSLRTASTHLETTKADLGHKVAADLTPDDIDRWISSHKDWTPATMNRYKATLGRALQLAVVSGHLQRNVARLVTARREDNTRVRWLKEDEEKRIIAAINKNCPAQLPAFIVALHTGLRQSEQFSLEWHEVDFERRKIFLDKTKTGRDREVPMSKTCFQVLSELHKKKTNNWVFLSTRYKGRRLENPRQWFETVLRDAKVENFHWHDLRHSFASRLVMKGVSLQTVSKLLGHASLTVTLRYAHLSPDHLAGAVDVLD
jgi:site-specific recombinase XerD